MSSVDYRNIARNASAIGFKMNHSSARNNVIRAMKKFVDGMSQAGMIPQTLDNEEGRNSIARSNNFQRCIKELTQHVSPCKL